MELAHNGSTAHQQTHTRHYWMWIRTGMAGGVIAGLVFAVFEMFVAMFAAGNMFAPLRMIAGTVFGQRALTPEVSLGMAAFTGVLVHMIYSVIAGGVFTFILAAFPRLHATTAAAIISGAAFGLLMWLVNFYAIAPAFGWTWFPTRASQFWQGFVAHTVFFGCVLGWFASTVREK